MAKPKMYGMNKNMFQTTGRTLRETIYSKTRKGRRDEN